MWTWYQREGEMWGPDGTRLCRGYSGAPGYVNAPDAQAVKGKGPIPRGYWRIGAPEDCCGGYALRLHGIDREELHRDRFLIHGDATMDTQDASQGCIIIPRPFRAVIWDSGVHGLRVMRERAVDEPPPPREVDVFTERGST
jgi:hypothetical protein